MYTAEYEGINSFLAGASKLLMNEGIERKIGNDVTIELPEPFMFKITNPTSRLITIPERKWNPILPYAESLWLAKGRNDLEFIYHYVKNIKMFSDDGIFLRGGYGPRLRKYNGIIDDYKIGSSKDIDISNLNKSEIDQFNFIIRCFEKDINTRQAIISLDDPTKDCFERNGNLKVTKDFPCTRQLHFQKQPNSNKLNLTVYMRSNDILWGASAVNIFNFTFMLEYFSQLLGLEIGNYYHISSNFHFYKKHIDVIESISQINITNDIEFIYPKSFNNLTEFDKKINLLIDEEQKLRNGIHSNMIDFGDSFFNDWFKTFYVFNTHKVINFSNPILNELFKKYLNYE